jgi:hypothetical protein
MKRPVHRPMQRNVNAIGPSSRYSSGICRSAGADNSDAAADLFAFHAQANPAISEINVSQVLGSGHRLLRIKRRPTAALAALAATGRQTAWKNRPVTRVRRGKAPDDRRAYPHCGPGRDVALAPALALRVSTPSDAPPIGCRNHAAKPRSDAEPRFEYPVRGIQFQSSRLAVRRAGVSNRDCERFARLGAFHPHRIDQSPEH